MSRKVKRIVGTAVFLLIFVALFYLVNQTLSYKLEDGIIPMQDMYQYPKDSIEVLFLGSSHIGINVDTQQLCEDYGMASYKLWGPTQQLWNSYHNLVEALKTQKPKVVVLETLGITHDIEYQGHTDAVWNTMGLKWSKNKYDAVCASFPAGQRLEAFLGFFQYHNRYKELNEKDFERFPWNFHFGKKNVKDWNSVYVGDLPSTSTKEAELGAKASKYFSKIVYLCKKNQIPLLMVSMPYSIPEHERAKLNTAKKLFEVYDLPYLDLITNYEAYGIDFNSDFGDSAGHLNSRGIQKATKVVGEYLKEHYELSENFGNPYFAYNIPWETKYSLLQEFQGDGQTKFIDTKLRLYDTKEESWTILTKLDPRCTGNDRILFSCFCERPPYHGLLVRINDAGQMEFVLGDNTYYQMEIEPNETNVTLAIVKEKYHYSIYKNGCLMTSEITSECEEYDGTLVLGGEYQADNRLGKLSQANIHKFEVYDEALSESDVLDWMEEQKEVLTKEEQLELFKNNDTGNVEYCLKERFEGNGQDRFVDTGVQLFHDPKKSWTLFTEIACNETDGAFLSCFSEEQENYRGLLIRKVGDVIQILLGNSQLVTTYCTSNDIITIAIRKEKSNYTVYVNGSYATSLEAPCEPYYGTLLVGCERDANLQLFRYSSLSVNRLEVIERRLSEKEIVSW